MKLIHKSAIREKKSGESKWLLIYSFTFFVMCIIIFSPFILKKKTLVSYADGYNQYLPAYIYTGRYLRHLPEEIIRRHQIPQFDFSIGFGDDIIGTLNYYGFGSVFTLTSVFVPPAYASIGYSLTILLKFYLAGIAFSLFEKKQTKSTVSMLVGALFYAFQGYALYYSTIFSAFGDVLVFFPLCLLGIDSIFVSANKKGDRLLLALSICTLSLSGFYFLYMASIPFVIYTLYKLKNRRTRRKKCVLSVLLSYIAGVCMSGIILLPALYGYLHSSRVGVKEQDIFHYLFSLPSLENMKKQCLALVLPLYEDGIGIPIIFWIILVLYYIRAKDKKCLGVMLLVLATFIPTVGSMMNGFSYSSNRWEFIVYFFFAWEITVIFHSFERWRIQIAVACLINISLYGLLFNFDWQVNFRSYQNTVASIESSVLAHYTYEQQNADGNDEVERLDIYDSSLGSSLALNTKSTTSYFSISNGFLFDFFNKLMISPGIRGARFCLKGLDGRQVLESLMSVKYYSQGERGACIEENEMRFPFGIVFTNVIDEEQVSKESSLSLTALLSNTLVLNELDCKIDASRSAVQNKVQQVPKDIKTNGIVYQGKTLYADKGGEVVVTPRDTKNGKGELYLFLHGFSYEDKNNEAEIRIGEKSVLLKGVDNRNYIGNLSDYLIKLDGDDESYAIQFSQEGHYFLESIELLWLDLNDFQEDYDELVSNGFLYEVENENNYISGRFDASVDGYLFLSIPYSAGWKCWVDGKETEIDRTDYAFMSIPVTEGTHSVVLKYRSPWILYGCMLSAVGFVMVILWRFSDYNSRQQWERGPLELKEGEPNI